MKNRYNSILCRKNKFKSGLEKATPDAQVAV